MAKAGMLIAQAVGLFNQLRKPRRKLGDRSTRTRVKGTVILPDPGGRGIESHCLMMVVQHPKGENGVARPLPAVRFYAGRGVWSRVCIIALGHSSVWSSSQGDAV